MTGYKKISKKKMLGRVIALSKAKGLSNLHCREIASALHCSTFPLYSEFGSLEGLRDQVCQLLCQELFFEALDSPKDLADFDQGLGMFFRNERRLFHNTLLDPLVGNYFYENYYVPLFFKTHKQVKKEQLEKIPLSYAVSMGKVLAAVAS